MQPADDLVFVHKWVPAESGSSDPVTLLLLHGTGDDENALLPVRKELWPGAALLALRGKVLENDLSSSFGRFTEADMGDLKSSAEELAQFIGAASKRYGFRKRRLIVVGYANGANLAASLILLHHPHYRSRSERASHGLDDFGLEKWVVMTLSRCTNSMAGGVILAVNSSLL